jgi:hypothetical protein
MSDLARKIDRPDRAGRTFSGEAAIAAEDYAHDICRAEVAISVPVVANALEEVADGVCE